MVTNFYKTTAVAISICLLAACSKLVEVSPPQNQLSGTSVFTNEKSAEAAVRGIYSSIMAGSSLFSFFTSGYGGLMADELYDPVSDNEFEVNQVSTENTEINQFWSQTYSQLYAANAVIANLAGSPINAEARERLSGEAKFLRGFIFFYLASFWNEAPMILTNDYAENSGLPRAGNADLYAQAIEDLTAAASSLPEATASGSFTRATRWAALALLARVRLYQQEWSEAEDLASQVIGSGYFELEADPSTVFLAGSKETVLGFTPVDLAYNTFDAINFIVDDGMIPSYALTNTLLNSFEAGDLRKSGWTAASYAAPDSFYFPAKYRDRGGSGLTENYIVLRLAELYLIRAEARLQLGNGSGALEDLNTIRTRAGVPASAQADASVLLLEIEQEKRIEFFAEWGHRWFDLKRTAQADAVLGALKPGTWQPTDAFWPVPQQQINLNNQLTQNPGY